MAEQSVQQESAGRRGPADQSQRLDHRLEIQAASIETVFQRHDLNAQVAGGRMASDKTRFVVEAQMPQQWQALQELEHDLAESLNVRRVQIEAQNGALYVDVDQGANPAVNLLDLLQRIAPLPPNVAVLGWTTDERPLLLNLAAEETTHLLIAGGPDAGKTSLLRTVAVSLALHNRQSQVQLLFIDPDLPGRDAEGSGLHAMQYLPHVLTGLVTQLEDVADVLAFLEEEMTYRARQRITQPRIVIFVDRLASLLLEDDGTIRKPLHALLVRGPASGIHLALTTRRPQASVLKQALPRRALMRVVGRVANPAEAQAALRLPDSGAEHLLGRGDFLARTGERTQRFQGAYVDEYDLHLCLERMHRRRPPAIVARPLLTRTQLPPSDLSVGDEQTFLYDGRQVIWTAAGAKKEGDSDEV